MTRECGIGGACVAPGGSTLLTRVQSPGHVTFSGKNWNPTHLTVTLVHYRFGDSGGISVVPRSALMGGGIPEPNLPRYSSEESA